LRAAAVYVGVLFLPLALACTIWPALTSWCRRLVEMLVALVLSKLVVVVVLESAVGALGTSQDRGFATVVTGIALLFLATMAPFTLLKLLPMFESTAAVHLEGLRQRGTSAMTRGLPRQGAQVALDALRSTPPLAAPAALAAASRAGRGMRSSLDKVGERTSTSPMSTSAIEADERSGAPPVRHSQPGTRGPDGPSPSPSASVAESWPSGEPPAPPPLAGRGTSLTIGHDRWGPVIRERREGDRP
jgi:hypothetical protein